MIKRIISLLIAFSMLNTFHVSANESIDEEIYSRISNSVVLLLKSCKTIVNGTHTYIDDKNKQIVPIVINDQILLPARFISESFGGVIKWNARLQQVTIKYKSTVIEMTIGKKDMVVNNTVVQLEEPPQLIYKRTFLPLRALVEALGKQVFWDEKGLIIVGEKKVFDYGDSVYIERLIELISFNRPTKEQILNDVFANNPNNQHPRLLIKKSDIDSIQERVKNDKFFSDMVEGFLKGAESILAQELPKYHKPDGKRLLIVSRATLSLLERLSMVWQLTGDERFAQRAWEVMEAVCSFQDWNESHFLDVGEMAAAVSIGFDWCYDYLDEEQRAFITQALRKYALEKAIGAYDGTAGRSHNRVGWIYSVGNWNAVCNGGIAMAALAIADEEGMADIAGECLYWGLASFEKMLPRFAPDGGWEEGVTYWSYLIKYFTMYIASLDSALGTDYGYFYAPGISRTMYFPYYLTGPTGTFNFGDAEVQRAISKPEALYFSRKLRDKDLAAMRLKDLKLGGGSLRDIIWYDAELYSEEVNLSLDQYFGDTEAVSMRSGWDDLRALSLILKGGNSDAGHGHFDMGSFVLDANGVRFAEDLGPDDYSLPGYMSDEKNYYRQRAEGHNTLVINPGIEPEMTFQSIAPARLISKDRGAIGIVDLSKTYSRDAEKVVRGFMLADNRTNVVMRDEINLKAEGEIYWFIHTKADIKIADDKSNAILTINGERLYVKLLTKGLEFTIMETKPLSTSPQYEGQKSNDGYRKLAIHLKNVKQTDITVAMYPLAPGEEIPENMTEIGNIDEWEIPDGTIPKVDSIMVNNQEIDGFSKNKFNYSIESQSEDKTPGIKATGGRVIQSRTVPGITYVTAGRGGNTSVYKIRVTAPPKAIEVDGRRKYDPVEVTASETPQPENGPYNTIDGDLQTRWAAQSAQWIMYDLGKSMDVGAVALAWYNGKPRKYKLNIELSKDGTKWVEVFGGETSGTTDDLEMYTFPTQQARFIRINCFASDVGSWNSLTECQIFSGK